ncbi:two-component system response regulator [Desulfogranum japonicum]|uniref:two-component system response regulator n=1 Tax=Desulfogranum japonicum TaxID=231447 RepID=UPI000407BDDC|nr:diguanylate cyclase [Desulfogranum japonicum]
MYKVLIVENIPVIIKLLSHFFQAQGCEIQQAQDGLEAINIMESYVPDILFTDLIMPKVSGEVLCRIVRDSQRLRDIFVVIYSAVAYENEDFLYQLDADLYIAKGGEGRIQHHIQTVIEHYRSGKKRFGIVQGTEKIKKRSITRELLLSRRHYLAIMENLAEAVIEMDISGQIVEANKAAQRLLARDFTSIVSRRLTEFIAGPGLREVKQWFLRAGTEDIAPFHSGYDNPLESGSHKILLHLVRTIDRDTGFIIAILQDITPQKQTEEQLVQTVQEFNAVMDAIEYGVLFMDSDLRARIANRALRDMWGLPDEILNTRRTFRELIHYNRHSGIYDMAAESFEDFAAQREALVKAGISEPKELYCRDGKVLQYQCVVLPDGGRMLTYFDITEHKETQAQLAKTLEEVNDLARHDALTGLPNIRLLQERFYLTSSIAKRKKWNAAILFLDLDGFKAVNDTYGHRTGDMVLKMVAQRLLRIVRKVDTVARLGGDEFLIILSEVHDQDIIGRVVEKILGQLAAPFEQGKIRIQIGASVGIALFPSQGENLKSLIKKADDAMYEAKRKGKQTYVFAS